MATREKKARMVGVNHVALTVGNVEEALKFYGEIFEFELRGREGPHAFIELGDQFLALFEGEKDQPDQHRHFGLVVDDRSELPERVRAAGGEMLEGPFLDFLDPWGNRVQVVAYADIEFWKDPGVLEQLGAGKLEKSEQAERDLNAKRGKTLP